MFEIESIFGYVHALRYWINDKASQNTQKMTLFWKNVKVKGLGFWFMFSRKVDTLAFSLLGMREL